MAARTFEDSSGIRWEVFEVRRASASRAAVSPGMEKGWLSFVSDLDKRRLAPYPEDWERADVRRLEQLCAEARRAASRPAPREAPKAAAAPRAGEGTRGLALRQHATPTRQPGASDGRLVAAPRDTPEVMTAVFSDAAEVESVVRGFAHGARATGLDTVTAMVRLKATLLERFPGDDHVARDVRRVRHWFVDAYYFERGA